MYGMIKSTLGIFFLYSTVVCASTDHEREVLANVVSELRALEQLIHIAEQAAQPNDRQRFDYAALRQDLTRVKQGINRHLHKPRFDPRRLPPLPDLNGDYH